MGVNRRQCDQPATKIPHKSEKTPDLGHFILKSGGTSPSNFFTAGNAPPSPAFDAHDYSPRWSADLVFGPLTFGPSGQLTFGPSGPLTFGLWSADFWFTGRFVSFKNRRENWKHGYRLQNRLFRSKSGPSRGYLIFFFFCLPTTAKKIAVVGRQGSQGSQKDRYRLEPFTGKVLRPTPLHPVLPDPYSDFLVKNSPFPPIGESGASWSTFYILACAARLITILKNARHHEKLWSFGFLTSYAKSCFKHILMPKTALQNNFTSVSNDPDVRVNWTRPRGQLNLSLTMGWGMF